MKTKSIYRSEEGKRKIVSFYTDILEENSDLIKKNFVTTRFGQTHVLSAGKQDAEVIVFLHGSSGNSAMRLNEMLFLSENYRVYAIDVIGECGLSSEARPVWKESNYSLWLSDVFGSLNVEKMHLVGNSLGGWIAIEYATENPECSLSLSLLATAGITNIRLSIIIMLILTSLAGRYGFNKLNRLVYGELEMDKRALQFAKLVKDHFKPRTDALPLFSDEQLSQIHTPVFFTGGENDCFYNSVKTANRLKQLLKDVETRIIPKSGHVLINQAEYLSEFISKKEEQ